MTAVVLLAGLIWAFRPRPIEVDLGEVTRGQLLETIDEDGRTRVKERYVVSAPLAGRVQRITLDEGDIVERGTTVLAVVEPALPALIDPRAREQAETAVRAAEASVEQTQAAVVRAEAELAKARVDLRRSEELLKSKAVSPDEVETNRLNVAVREAELRSAHFAVDVARHQLEQARAALLAVSDATTRPSEAMKITSPINGRVLRVLQESETVVPAGAGLVEVGDIGQLEAVIDVLSRDAVRIRPGAGVILERWGGEQDLRGVVRRVEPSAFTKISALGVEEQRVNVVVDLVDRAADGEMLGDGYRVDARIIIWQGLDVLRIPTGALFRDGEAWAAFVADNGTARLRRLKIGVLNPEQAEVLDGLRPGDLVVLHPSDKVRDGVSIVPRANSR